MKNIPGMNTFHARHEHCACAMALSYTLAIGKVGVAAVTCGPGLTQITTALTTAARSRMLLAVFAGEAPMHAKWYNQALDQPPFAAACGAHCISAHSPQPAARRPPRPRQDVSLCEKTRSRGFTLIEEGGAAISGASWGMILEKSVPDFRKDHG